MDDLPSANTLQPPTPSPWRRRTMIAASLAVGVPLTYLAVTTPLPGLTGRPEGIPGVGTVAPNFSLRTIDGGTVDLRALRGRPVLVNFWATWCTPCREELPEIELAFRAHRTDGLAVVAISLDSEVAARDIPEFLALGGEATGAYTFTVGLDLTQEVMKRYRLIGVPSTFFVDRTGIIRSVQPGAMNRAVLASGLQAILGATSG